MKLILASGSPRRQALLKQIHIPFTIRKPNVDEGQIQKSDPREKVLQLAALKNEHTPIKHTDEVILSADTVVSHHNQIFGKPKDKQDALNMISLLSGDVHDVYTGVVIRSNNKKISFVERTEVTFRKLSRNEIEWYVSKKEPYDKAGAYGIQGMGAIFVKGITGDFFNVVGLPVSRVAEKLRSFFIFPE
ncbi:Maf family protein [Virgibacillus sp. YIM 98842]|uniref:Maf family protein n=1 Tax=Virgibacillus sp. YIM 98842 TaxID=2663533 RepID=UPI003204F66C